MHNCDYLDSETDAFTLPLRSWHISSEIGLLIAIYICLQIGLLIKESTCIHLSGAVVLIVHPSLDSPGFDYCS